MSHETGEICTIILVDLTAFLGTADASTRRIIRKWPVSCWDLQLQTGTIPQMLE